MEQHEPVKNSESALYVLTLELFLNGKRITWSSEYTVAPSCKKQKKKSWVGVETVPICWCKCRLSLEDCIVTVVSIPGMELSSWDLEARSWSKKFVREVFITEASFVLLELCTTYILILTAPFQLIILWKNANLIKFAKFKKNLSHRWAWAFLRQGHEFPMNFLSPQCLKACL